MPQVIALVLHYNSPQAALEVVENLLNQTVPAERIVVIDNASREEAIAQLSRELPGSVQFTRLPTNGGYGAAMNVGIGMAEAEHMDFCVLLTHDVALPDTYIEQMLTVMRDHSNCAVAGPLLAWRSDRTRVFSAGGTLHGSRTAHRASPAGVEEWRGREPFVVDWVDGAVIFLRTQFAIRGESRFWEPYFLYYEELDFQAQLRDSGYDILLAPGIVSAQEPGNLSPYLAYRNRVLFARRNLPAIPWLEIFADATRSSLMWARARRFGAWLWIMRGLFDGMIGRAGPPPPAALRLDWSPANHRRLRIRRRAASDES